MAARANKDFKVIVYYPTEENKEEFENRLARTVAGILCDALTVEEIDNIIEIYKEDSHSMKE